MKAHIKRNNIKFESKLYLFSIKSYGRKQLLRDIHIVFCIIKLVIANLLYAKCEINK